MLFMYVQEVHLSVASFDSKHARPHIIKGVGPETRGRALSRSWRSTLYLDGVLAKKQGIFFKSCLTIILRWSWSQEAGHLCRRCRSIS